MILSRTKKRVCAVFASISFGFVVAAVCCGDGRSVWHDRFRIRQQANGLAKAVQVTSRDLPATLKDVESLRSGGFRITYTDEAVGGKLIVWVPPEADGAHVYPSQGAMGWRRSKAADGIVLVIDAKAVFENNLSYEPLVHFDALHNKELSEAAVEFVWKERKKSDEELFLECLQTTEDDYKAASGPLDVLKARNALMFRWAYDMGGEIELERYSCQDKKLYVRSIQEGDGSEKLTEVFVFAVDGRFLAYVKPTLEDPVEVMKVLVSLSHIRGRKKDSEDNDRLSIDLGWDAIEKAWDSE